MTGLEILQNTVPPDVASSEAAILLPHQRMERQVGYRLPSSMDELRGRIEACAMPEELQRELQQYLPAIHGQTPTICLEGPSGSGKDLQETSLFQILQPGLYETASTKVGFDVPDFLKMREMLKLGDGKVRLVKLAGFIDMDEQERYVWHFDNSPLKIFWSPVRSIQTRRFRLERALREISYQSTDDYLDLFLQTNSDEVRRMWQTYYNDLDYEEGEFPPSPEQIIQEYHSWEQAEARRVIEEDYPVGEDSWHMLQNLWVRHLSELQNVQNGVIVANRGPVTRLLNFAKYPGLRRFADPFITRMELPGVDLESLRQSKGFPDSSLEVQVPFPQLTIYPDVNEDELIKRIRQDSGKEDESERRIASVVRNRQAMLDVARHLQSLNPEKVMIIDGNKDKDEVTREILEEIKKRWVLPMEEF